MQPYAHGANIIIHSLTKWLGGHGIAIVGAVVNGGNVDWSDKEKFPTISGDHFALGGISFWEELGPAALTMKIRAEGMYNFGPSISPTNAFYLMQGIETLPLRMKKHMENTHELLSFLQDHELVEWVKHPDLETHPDHLVAKKILPKGSGSVVVFGIKGGRKARQTFIESVQLASHLANVGDAKILGFESVIDLNLKKILNMGERYSFNYFINTSVIDSKYTRAIINGIVGNKVEFVPDINLKTGIRFGFDNFTSSIQYTYLSDQFSDAENSFSGDVSGIVGVIPSYDILDISASYKYKIMKLEAGVNNLLDNKFLQDEQRVIRVQELFHLFQETGI